MLNLKPNSKERLEIVSLFRKRGNFVLKTEKNILKDENDGEINEERPYIDEETGSSEEGKKEKDKITKAKREKTTKCQTKNEGTSSLKPIVGRSRWTSAEKDLVVHYFRKHIEDRVTPKFHECREFLSKYGNKMVKKDWVKVKTLVYNTFRLKK